MGGSLGEMHANKIVKAMRMALSYGSPFIAINDSGGARIQEGVDSLAGYARIFDANCEASGVIPQLSVIMGPCAGGAVYSPALTDFIFMTENSYMFITGPDVVRAVMQEDVSQEELGGGMVHSVRSGVAHFLAPDDRLCLQSVRQLLSYLPSNNQDDPPYIRPADDPDRRCPELEQIVPTAPHKPYDVRQVISSLVDEGRFHEVRALWAENLVVGFARLNGWVVVSWPTSRWCWPAASTSKPRSRRRTLSACAMPTTSRSSPCRTFPASCPARTRNMAALSATAPA
jgi:propionyl-CoA carboxylase beta chain